MTTEDFDISLDEAQTQLMEPKPKARRRRSPIVRVCRGDYLRISKRLVEQFGFDLELGQQFEFSLEILADGKVLLMLTSIQELTTPINSLGHAMPSAGES